MSKDSNAIAFLFSILLFPEIAKKSKEELLEYVEVIKESGKITDEEYQKAIKFVEDTDELKQMIREKYKSENENNE